VVELPGVLDLEEEQKLKVEDLEVDLEADLEEEEGKIWGEEEEDLKHKGPFSDVKT
jgi:hypothetical protein